MRIPADRWDYQYRRGTWDNLPAERGRLEAVIALIASHYLAPSILEIGCGKAIMLQQMQADAFSTYTGVDLSKVAINEASRYSSQNVHFINADMHTFVPDACYDVIVFNESLYYAKDPAALFDRYLPYLNVGASVTISAFQNKYTAHLWPAIEQKWKPIHMQQVINDGYVWDIRMYKP